MLVASRQIRVIVSACEEVTAVSSTSRRQSGGKQTRESRRGLVLPFALNLHTTTRPVPPHLPPLLLSDIPRPSV